MKKTLLLSAVSVAGAAALVGSMTFAAFNDFEDVTGPNVAAGTIELDQWGTQMPFPVSVSNMAPGDVVEIPVTLENEGTLPGHLYGKVDSIVGHEDGCDVYDLDGFQIVDPARVERVVDPDCGNIWGPGDLLEYLTIELVLPGGSTIDLADAGPADFIVAPMAAHAIQHYTVRVTFENTPLAGDDVYTIDPQNKAQGDSASINLKFALVADAA